MFGKSKGWWQEKALLFLFLLIAGFVISPNAVTRGAYCGFGFKSFCVPDPTPDTMQPGEVRTFEGGWKVERIN